MTGILVVDKPKDFTSFDVIAKLRSMLRQRKLGHGGTLDPMATGVLPVFVGGATKAADLLPNTDKRYTAAVRLGVRTDTGDISGTVVETCAPCAESRLREVLPAFLGPQQQIPPMYSAVKVDGKRLYELARQGREVVRKARDIRVDGIDLLSFDESAGSFVLDVRCGKGTYIRTLAEDIAAAAGSCATLTALRRTESAGFTASMARTLDDIQSLCDEGDAARILLSVDSAFTGYSPVALDKELARLYLHGVVFDCRRLAQQPAENEPLRVYSGAVFLGLARCENGRFIKMKQFYTED